MIRPISEQPSYNREIAYTALAVFIIAGAVAAFFFSQGGVSGMISQGALPALIVSTSLAGVAFVTTLVASVLAYREALRLAQLPIYQPVVIPPPPEEVAAPPAVVMQPEPVVEEAHQEVATCANLSIEIALEHLEPIQIPQLQEFIEVFPRLFTSLSNLIVAFFGETPGLRQFCHHLQMEILETLRKLFEEEGNQPNLDQNAIIDFLISYGQHPTTPELELIHFLNHYHSDQPEHRPDDATCFVELFPPPFRELARTIEAQIDPEGRLWESYKLHRIEAQINKARESQNTEIRRPFVSLIPIKQNSPLPEETQAGIARSIVPLSEEEERLVASLLTANIQEVKACDALRVNYLSEGVLKRRLVETIEDHEQLSVWAKQIARLKVEQVFNKINHSLGNLLLAWFPVVDQVLEGISSGQGLPPSIIPELDTLTQIVHFECLPTHQPKDSFLWKLSEIQGKVNRERAIKNAAIEKANEEIDKRNRRNLQRNPQAPLDPHTPLVPYVSLFAVQQNSPVNDERLQTEVPLSAEEQRLVAPLLTADIQTVRAIPNQEMAPIPEEALKTGLSWISSFAKRNAANLALLATEGLIANKAVDELKDPLNGLSYLSRTPKELIQHFIAVGRQALLTRGSHHQRIIAAYRSQREHLQAVFRQQQNPELTLKQRLETLIDCLDRAANALAR